LSGRSNPQSDVPIARFDFDHQRSQDVDTEAASAATVLRVLTHRCGDVIVDPVSIVLIVIIGTATANGIGTHLFDGGVAHRACPPQYVARPPEISNTAPVEKEQSSLASHEMRAAISSGATKRFMGIFPSMY